MEQRSEIDYNVQYPNFRYTEEQRKEIFDETF